ncbi:MAG: prephenate dehydrogenase [Candidatus Nanopelagicales bacterium]
MMQVLIVGSGLLGTSLGLALRQAGHEVWLADRLSEHVEVARKLGAGQPVAASAEPQVVIVAVPPSQFRKVVNEYGRRYVNATFTDVSSIKTQPLADVESIQGVHGRFVGGHPMAGRETSGPAGARADLFVDRLWILTPTEEVPEARLEEVRGLAEDCGSVVRIMTPEAHDRAVALTSHTPQVVASVMAGLIARAPVDDIQLSGQGLRDLTRIAGSSPELWDDILTANADEVDVVLAAFEAQLSAVRSALRAGASVREMLHVGNAGRARIPAKHGGPARTEDAVLSVSVDDRPGALARLFAAAADANISIEDVRIDHMLGRENAVVDLSVRAEVAPVLRELLIAGGWKVRS